MRAHGILDKVRRVAHLRLLLHGGGEQRHGHFGEVVVDYVVDPAGPDELRGRRRGVAPEPGAARHPHALVGVMRGACGGKQPRVDEGSTASKRGRPQETQHVVFSLENDHLVTNTDAAT